jgi:hypothetical protein
MRKNLKQVLLFLLLVVIILYGVQYLIDYCYRKRVTNKFTELLTHKTDVEVMIFGSSVAYHQFDPAVIRNVTGLTSYNMGWPGMFFIQYNGLVKEYLDYEQKCKCIVLACDFDNLGKNKLITRPDLFWAYLGNNNVYRSLNDIDYKETFHARYLPGYKMTLLNKAFYTDLFLGSHKTDTLNGYEPMPMPWEQSDTIQPFNARYDEDVFEQLKATIETINKKGIKVVLVIPPVLTDGYKLILNAEQIKAKYRSLAGKNVYFLDYTNDPLCSSKSNFRNFTHLNMAGATMFSHNFAQDLLKIVHD